MDTVEDIDAAINTVDCINKDVNGEENTNGGANRHEGDNHQEVSKQNAANGEDFETGKSGKEKAEEEASTLRREYNDVDMEEADNDEEQSEGGSDDSFIEHSHNEESSSSNNDGDLNIKVDLTESEIDELISELLEVESKAAEAQEKLELESLKQVEDEVRAELALHLQGDELDIAVSTEMNTFVEQWEMTLDELETECSLLLEQLDGGGVELPSLYKLIESQAPNGCSTDAWKKMTHWVGSQVTPEVKEVISNAEEHLESCRPLRRKHGKLLEEGAGGFLSKKMAAIGNENCEEKNIQKDWKSFNACVQSSKHAENTMSFGSINWASVYLASTPQQAAEMGLKFPGVDEVEEIDEISPIDSCDPLYADAVANEQFLQLSGENKQNFRKIREEDDILITKKLHNHLRRRRRKRWQDFSQNDACTVDQVMKDSLDKNLSGTCSVNCRSRDEGLCSVSLSKKPLGKDVLCCAEHTGSRSLSPSRDDMLLCQSKENDFANKAHDTVIIDSDEEDKVGYSLPAKEGNDIIDVDAFPDADAIKDFQCTACSKYLHSSKVNKHPHLKVIICEHCKCAMEAKMHNKEAYPIELYCRWCGSSNDLKSCNSCDVLFCRTCIKRNLPDEQFLVLEASGWQCFSCTPTVLQKLISDYEKAFGSVVLSSSDNDSEYSDSDIHISLSKKKRRKRKIRRILDDTELGEETKLKIEMEKARQEHLRSMHFSGNRCRNEASVNTAEEGDAKNGYIINVAREEDEESVRIPPSISSKLKSHQIEGIRFLWQNIIQSVRKVKFGDKGLGCILAHTMGLGKTLQVIGFLYTALRCTDLGFKTALIVTPVNVLHNWRHEFRKWRPLEVEALRVFMLEDVPRERRPYLLSKWRRKGGVLLIGYAAFRNLSFGKHEKDKNIAREIACALQAPDILVCDEAHMIKNVRADVTQALKQVKTQRRIALTGSPLQNNLMEYYCMVDFVREGFLGSSHEFRNRFQNPIENGQHANSTRDDVKIMNQRSHILYEQLKGFVQRRDMNVVKNELPPKTVYVISVKLSPLQKKLYKRFLDVHGFTNKEVSNDKTGRLRCFFAGYQALARIWNHPGLLQLVKEHRDKLLQEDIVETFLGDDAYSDYSSSDGNLEHAHIRNGDDRRSKDDSSPRINVNAAFGKMQSKRRSNLDPERLSKLVFIKYNKSLHERFQTRRVQNKSEDYDPIVLDDLNYSSEWMTGRPGACNEFVYEEDGLTWAEDVDWWKDIICEKIYKEVDHSGKMVLLLEILSMSAEIGDKTLVFSQSLATLDLIESFLSKLLRNGRDAKFWKKGKDWYRLDGSTKGSERQNIIERFNEPSNRRVKCALISTRAGSLGINLHAANRVVIVDGSWNPTHDLQAIYRSWRYGQIKPVYAYRLMAHGTMEEKIYKRQVTKEGLSARIMDRQQIHRTMSKEEMLHLFDFGDDENIESVLEQSQQMDLPSNHVRTSGLADFLKQKSLSVTKEVGPSDEFMVALLNKYYPRWIQDYHEHETLLQENEDERLSKEEKDMALENFLRTIEWEEVHRVSDVSSEKKLARNPPPPAEESRVQRSQENARIRSLASQRKCSNLSHLLTLRSQGTKSGSTAVCGECSQEISWENLSRDRKR